jgi:hypothetical protein
MQSEEQLRERVTELEKRREELVMAANRELASLNGRIDELKRLLGESSLAEADAKTE